MSAGRGVGKLFRLIKRKPKNRKHSEKEILSDHDNIAGDATVDNVQNEASLVSRLSTAGVSAAQSWGNNSDVFSGVVSGISPRRKFEPSIEGNHIARVNEKDIALL